MMICNKREQTINEVSKKIMEGKNFLVASHMNPEGDAIGSALAMAQGLKDLGKKVRVFFEDPIPEIYRFLPFNGEVIHKLDGQVDYDTAVIVDCGGLDRIGKGFQSFQKDVALINLDHHTTNTNFGEINLVDSGASATGEIVYDILKALSVKVSPEIALNIYVSIMTDTGAFRYSSTTPKAFEIASEMVRIGVKPWEVARRVYESYPEKKLRLLGDTLQTLKVSEDGSIASVYVDREMMERVNATKDLTDGFVNFPRSIAGVEVAFLIREISPGICKVSFRSKGTVDVAEIAAEFGGGGHHNAAGSTVEGKLSEVRKMIGEITEKKVREDKP